MGILRKFKGANNTTMVKDSHGKIVTNLSSMTLPPASSVVVASANFPARELLIKTKTDAELSADIRSVYVSISEGSAGVYGPHHESENVAHEFIEKYKDSMELGTYIWGVDKDGNPITSCNDSRAAATYAELLATIVSESRRPDSFGTVPLPLYSDETFQLANEYTTSAGPGARMFAEGAWEQPDGKTVRVSTIHHKVDRFITLAERDLVNNERLARAYEVQKSRANNAASKIVNPFNLADW